MKKFALFLSFLLLMVACKQPLSSHEISKEELVRNFAENFVNKVSLNQIDSLKFVYPEIINAPSLNHIKGSSAQVMPTPDPNVWDIKFDNVSLQVKVLDSGNMEVMESRGLFVFPPEKMKIAKQTGLWDESLTDKELNERMSDNEFFKYIEDLDTSPDVWLISIGQIKKPTSYDDRIAHQELFNHTLHEIKGKDYSVIVRGRSNGPATDDYNGGWEEFEYTKPGKNIPALGSVTYDLEWYFRVEEEIVGIDWNISDEEIFDKYLSYSGNEYELYLKSKRTR